MYHNFIAPARAENRLNTLVVELLRAYYEVDTVRDCVDKRMTKTEELRVMQEHIDKMLLEHVKTMTQTQALQFETQQVAQGVTASDTISIVNEKEQTTENSAEAPMTMLEMSNMLRAIANRVGLGENLNGVSPTKTFENTSKIEEEQRGAVTPPKSVNGNYNANLAVSEGGTKTETNVPKTPAVTKTADVVTGGNTRTEQKIENKAKTEGTVTKKPRRPASFGKVCAGLEKTEA